MLTNHFQRVSLAHLPTPLEEMSRLRQALGGGPRLLIKRDDQTGLATGGNKTRKLEFVAADALAREADTLVTVGGPQSNHCRQTAAAAAKLGLRCVLLLRGEPLPQAAWHGNLLLDALLDAEVRWIDDQDFETALVETATTLRAEGARPYVIPLGASMPLGAIGYVAAVEELAGQLAEWETTVDRIVFPSGSAGTQAGLLVGVKALKLKARVEGVYVSNEPGFLEKIETLTADTMARLGLTLPLTEDDFCLHERYGRPGYGVVTAAEREAIRLLARTEGIIADPVYTGRALAGLLDLIRQQVYAPTETVLFWHTGGVAGLFAQAAEVLGEKAGVEG